MPLPDTKEETYKALESTFLSYQRLAAVLASDNGDEFVNVASFGLVADTRSSVLLPSTGNDIYVREGTAQKLVLANAKLSTAAPGCSLCIAYGYRSLEVQTASFQKMRREMGYGDSDAPEVLEKVHWNIAVPTVAGHPTGGAVDVYIIDAKGVSLDFGTKLHAFEKDSYVFSPFISEQARQNRGLLRDVMLSAGFAPFDGEWWHFSYGDQEWAAYHGHPAALYAQVPESGMSIRQPLLRKIGYIAKGEI